MKKQTITILLLLSLLLGSCGSTAAEDTTETDAQAAQTETAQSETVYPLAVTEADYGGDEFRSLCYTRQAPGTMKQYLDFAWSDDLKGEVLNDAIFARNLRVEEDFNPAEAARIRKYFVKHLSS